MSECITNVSLMSTNKFAIAIAKFPAVQFFCQKVDIPSVRIGETKVYTNKDIDIWLPGDKVQYEDLNVTFLLDEDMLSYKQLKEWMHMATSSELADAEKFSDVTVMALTNNGNVNVLLNFELAFPSYISPILFDSTRTEEVPITVDVSFKFSVYTVK